MRVRGRGPARKRASTNPEMSLAFYKCRPIVPKTDEALFDQSLLDGARAPRAEIRCCPICVDGIGSTHQPASPAAEHHAHPTGLPPAPWRLLAQTPA